jgi:hypothetical protein
VSFPEWCGYYYSLRLFFSASKKGLFMEYEEFKSLVDGYQLFYYKSDYLPDSTTTLSTLISPPKRK